MVIKMDSPNVIFLDRDGVINIDSPDYIKNRFEFHFIEGSLEAIKLLTQYHYLCIIISNQSMINRNISTLDHLMDMNSYMFSKIQAHGGHIQDFFFCPHRPDEQCSCRKPKTGMIQKAASKYAIDISKSIMIGDSLKDMQCANNAGCRHVILVRTGNGRKTERLIDQKDIKITFIADNLLAAAHWIKHSCEVK
jgi:D-glycero-D-manno-heptose 1,7-bisphosphate phosphatase